MAAAAKNGVKRGAETGRFVSAIDEADARKFRRANSALIKEVATSRAKAVEVLKASGFLTQSGKRSQRYR